MKFKEQINHKMAAPYPSRIYVVVSSDPTRSVSKLNKTHNGIDLVFEDNHIASCSNRYHYDNKHKKTNYQILLFDSNYLNNGVIAHEALHATNNILKYAGVVADFDNDEPQTYLLQDIVNFIEETATKFKKKK